MILAELEAAATRDRAERDSRTAAVVERTHSQLRTEIDRQVDLWFTDLQAALGRDLDASVVDIHWTDTGPTAGTVDYYDVTVDDLTVTPDPKEPQP